MARKFCDSQTQCSDKPKGTYTCTAHLNENRAPDCNLRESDIYFTHYKDGEEKIHYRFQIKFDVPKNSAGDGVCRDFRILPDVKKDLIAKLPKDLASKTIE